MEDKVLISSVKHGDVTVQRYMDKDAMNKPLSIDCSDLGEVTIYEKVIEPIRPKLEYVSKAESKRFWKKEKQTKKLQKLSKLGSAFERIARQQLADRRSITKDYSISFEQWCKEQYNVDATK